MQYEKKDEDRFITIHLDSMTEIGQFPFNWFEPETSTGGKTSMECLVGEWGALYSEKRYAYHQ